MSWHEGVGFGLHFDLHANETDQVGAALSVEHLLDMLGRVHPDFVHCDCKGHIGYASYPTKIGTPAPHIVKDSLRIWRDATRNLGIPLILHYSGIYDNMALKAHPEWGRVNDRSQVLETWMLEAVDADGLDSFMVCPLSAYTVDYMAAQMVEIIDAYDVDGFWVDGENWASSPCYCPICTGGFHTRTGLDKVPRSALDAGWKEWLDYGRANFEEHVRRFADIVHRRKPSCTVCSNWMYTLRQPDPVTVPVDYLSGDFSWIWSTKTALVEARFMDGRGLSWDLMGYGFTSHGPMKDWTFKSIPALCQEAGVVLSCGGAFMVYDQPNRSGDLIGWHMDDLAAVAAFCRDRKHVVYGTASVPQVAILHSRHHVYRTNQPLFGPLRTGMPAEGAVHALLELGYHVDILQDESLLERLDQYPVIVVPEQTGLPESMIASLKGYVERGGRLLVSGTSPTESFDAWFGLEEASCEVPTGPRYLADGRRTVATVGEWRTVRLRGDLAAVADLKAVEPLLPTREASIEGTELVSIAAACRRIGEGRAVVVVGNVFEGYADSHYPGTRRFIARLLEALEPKGLLSVKAPLSVHATLRTDGRNLQVHLVNLGSDKPLSPGNAYIEDVPSVGPIDIDLPLEKPPKRVYLEPGNRSVNSCVEEGRLQCRIPTCGIHDILVVEMDKEG